MTDLVPAERVHVLEAMLGVELALRALLHPDKMNLASLGNKVPHLHWHVIARFVDDPHFPDPIWSPRRRAGERRTLSRSALVDRVRRELGTGEALSR
jgi:diadenosine tetraphosphate (Ap4A) HIT family hydrolase